MKNFFLIDQWWCVLIALLLSVTIAQAQFSVVADNQKASYNVGQSMNFLVTGASSGQVNYKIEYSTRENAPIITSTKSVSGGQAAIPFTLNQPGYVVITVTQGGNTAVAGAGFGIYNIQPTDPNKPSDFQSFWDGQKNALSQVPLNTNISLVTETSYSKTYSINLANIDNRRVYGSISIPKGITGPFPAVLLLPAAGNQANHPGPQPEMAERGGAISMSVSVHNNPLNQPGPGNYTSQGYTDRNTNYYKYALTGIMRAIDYIESRPDFNGNLAVNGVSQGGGLTLLIAGIDDRVDLIAANVAALSDHHGATVNKYSSYPWYHEKAVNSGQNPAAVLAETKYYDAAYAATQFQGKALLMVNYKDDICPPANVMAAYNGVPGQKVILHNRELGHSGTVSEFWSTSDPRGRLAFFRSYFTEMQTNFPWPYPPTITTHYEANAGPDKPATANSPINLTGSVTYNGSTNNSWPVKWIKKSGPGSVNFGNPNNRNTTAIFSTNGTYILQFVADDTNYLSSTGNRYFAAVDQVKVTVGGGTGQQNQSITFNSIPNKQTTDGPFSISANASSGLPVSFSLLSGPASISGNTVTLNGQPGTVTIRASQGGNSSYNPAPNVNRTFTVSQTGNPGTYCDAASSFPWHEWVSNVKLNTIDNSSPKTAYGDYTNLSTTLNKGTTYNFNLTVTYSWVTYTEQIRVWIDYNQDGDFDDSGESVVAQTMSPPASGSGANKTISASISVPGSATNGTTRMRVALRRNSAPASCGTVDFGEVEDYSVNISGSGGQQSQTINFPGIPNMLDNAPPYSLNASASSGLQVSYQILSGPASINGSTLTLTGGIGTVLISASQGGNSSYFPAPTVTRTFTVSPAGGQLQTINFPSISDKLTTDGPFGLNASASSGLSVSYAVLSGPASMNGNVVSLNGSTGTVTIRASQAGNSNYDPAPNVNRSFIVNAPPSGNYCASQSGFPWHEWISKVTFVNINNNSVKTTYSDFTGQSANVSAGSAHNLSLTATYSWQTFPENWRVWIDFNQNKVFESSELVLQKTGPEPPNQTGATAGVNGTISIPSNAKNGATRMRVSMSRNGSPSACENPIAFGEVEDYTVNITGGSNRDDHSLVSLQVFPNPAIDQLNIRYLLASDIPQKGTLSVRNVLGQIIKQQSFEPATSDLLVMNLEDLGPGYYFLQVEMDDYRSSHKFLKLSK